MGRKVGSKGSRTEAIIRREAIRLIAAHGFEAMTLRQLAAKVGIQAGTVYRYFPGKTDLLHTLLVEIMRDLLRTWEARRPRDGDPLVLLKAFIEVHLRYHITHHEEAFIADMELRSLTKESYKVVTELRAQYEEILRDILLRGVKAGRFKVPDMKVAVYGILAMLTGVYIWYRKGGSLSVNAIIKHYTSLILEGTEST
jgi:AcrR family transcriptional regulator